MALYMGTGFLPSYGMSATLQLFALISFITGGLFYIRRSKSSTIPKSALPKFVAFTDEQMRKDPWEAYRHGLEIHGGVIATTRAGRLLNLYLLPMICGESVFRDLATTTSQLMSRDLPAVLRKITPMFQANAKNLISAGPGTPVDPVPITRRLVCNAAITVMLGEEFLSDANHEAVMNTVEAIAELTGLVNEPPFLARLCPALWRVVVSFKVAVFRIGLGFGSTLGVHLWREMSALLQERPDKKNIHKRTVLSGLVHQQIQSQNGDLSLSFRSRIRIIILIIGMFFAAIHQTGAIMVWMLYGLAMQPESQAQIRAEALRTINLDPHPHLNPDSDDKNNLNATINYILNPSTYLDSFVREVLRMKGDILSVVRMTTRDVQVGQYIIPKGKLVLPGVRFSNLSASYNGELPNEFRADRWFGGKRSAVTTGPGFLVFGMGKWACPGRFLAVAEMKLLILTLIKAAAVGVADGVNVVSDDMTASWSPPQGKLCLTPL
ncbi:cytochrome P450 [Aspergillus affinis]|uniref:cytochrome P450 n=1 Tax=Aspergillus affinis TaxID=1070780 RepID=UPI0022FE8E3E|nr:cytochrome P450 [Aspergillus affinis]KAI9039121.1 cytochrome P450 [Aspergillus affinis]